jgi:Na+-translocating ferredoxin:NAD+ oxidoreductase RnfD subunit
MTRTQDPRLYQIGVLFALLVYGVSSLDFDVSPGRIGLTLGVCLATQYACSRLWALPRFDPLSALISGLSLCLLLRTDRPGLVVIAAVVTIASKFLCRVDGRHLFNPTNLGLVVMLLVSGHVWVSPGQWGSVAFGVGLMAGLGGLVVHRAERGDVTYAFLASYGLLVVGRAVWLGDPLTIPLLHLQSGALLLFAFLMISDPKTTPDSRRGRICFAVLVASGGAFVEFGLHRPNGLLWALAAAAPLTLAINRIFPGPRFNWSSRVATDDGSLGTSSLRSRHDAGWRTPVAADDWSLGTSPHTQKGHVMTLTRATRIVRIGLLTLVAWIGVTPAALAFCGFYVSKADTTLFNRASKVVLVRDGDRTVVTMSNDFHGDPQEFAMVIPVPTTLTRDQIHVGEQAVLDHLDAYTAPRLVEYHDPDPRYPVVMEMARASAVQRPTRPVAQDRLESLGVTIEATYAVGEYDIVILSAEQSGGLQTWLHEEGYQIPTGATEVLGSYIKQGMRFFVARVNLEEQAALGYTYLRPLQIAYESPKFMLPIRLGTLNADGPQDLFVFALTRTGRVETRNYRTVAVPTDMELPVYLKQPDEFAAFYQAMFSRQVDEAQRRGVFLEYAWDMSWCDPCAADPLSRTELQDLGVFWLDDAPRSDRRGAAQDVFVTRLHVRYDAKHFPDDLRFQETADRSNVQGRYVLRQPWQGAGSCEEVMQYRQTVAVRQEREAQTLASLTGWDLETIRTKMGLDSVPAAAVEANWWDRLWRQ